MRYNQFSELIMREGPSLRPGATRLAGGGWQFLVWAPKAERVDLCLASAPAKAIALHPEDHGYFRVLLEDVEADAKYVYRLDGRIDRPDPASRFQPAGIHGPSQVADLSAFPWSDSGWRGRAIEEYVLYELHVGTYTPDGTFEAVIPYLDQLAELGITALELMPVAQFPGARNWGYDGAQPFATQNTYGGPRGLAKLVNAAHQRGLAVVLDVVYNHLGPEGNYLGDYGYYFTDRYRTPWGAALNFDGPHSDEIRRFFVENAIYWLEELHIDALRLDAVHGIVDTSAFPFLAELAWQVHTLARRLHRKLYLIAESDLNDARLVQSPEQGGYDLDAQWSDDFHHAVHTLLTGERNGYYADFGQVQDLATTFAEGWAYSGRYSKFRQRRHGNSPRGIPRHKFVVCNQNHDQVGNRAQGERLSGLVDFEGLKLAAGVTLLSPFLPLLFMGEEYGETAPFQYFTSHSDPNLIAAVRRGRREEFAGFEWNEEVPDPQADSTFLASRLNHGLRHQEPHRTLYSFYRELIRFRRDRLPGNFNLEVTALESEESLMLRHWNDSSEILTFFNFRDSPLPITPLCPSGAWQKELDSADKCWRGPGGSLPSSWEPEKGASAEVPPRSFAVFGRSHEPRK
jgi:maltooligosyltrehalose trehalohydrolase